MANSIGQTITDLLSDVNQLKKLTDIWLLQAMDAVEKSGAAIEFSSSTTDRITTLRLLDKSGKTFRETSWGIHGHPDPSGA